jgi:septum formation protein
VTTKVLDTDGQYHCQQRLSQALLHLFLAAVILKPVDNSVRLLIINSTCYSQTMIILASGSATRKTLLERAGIPFIAISPSYDENLAKSELPHANPRELALHLATGKARSLSRLRPDAVVVGADQTLSCNGHLLHKPGTRANAKQQLRQLRGKSHVLFSAACCARDGDIEWSCCEQATITFWHYPDTFIDQYLEDAGDNILSSVGAYHYEAIGIRLMEKVEGSDHVILGLPLLSLVNHLRSMGHVPS